VDILRIPSLPRPRAGGAVTVAANHATLPAFSRGPTGQGPVETCILVCCQPSVVLHRRGVGGERWNSQKCPRLAASHWFHRRGVGGDPRPTDAPPFDTSYDALLLSPRAENAQRIPFDTRKLFWISSVGFVSFRFARRNDFFRRLRRLRKKRPNNIFQSVKICAICGPSCVCGLVVPRSPRAPPDHRR